MALFSTQLKKPLGIYVHIPFCRSKCHYCDFYSVTDLDSMMRDSFLDAVCDHIRETGPLAPVIGWTPSILVVVRPATLAQRVWR